MLIRTQTSRPDERKAVILLVVISLLTLFAIVALSFLLYANAEANASKLFREAEANDLALAGGVAPDKLLNFFLRQFIYDVPDDTTGIYSALRGHSLARSIYGSNYGNPNLIAFNGTGRLHTNGTPMNPWNMDDYLLPNYTVYANVLPNGAVALTDGFARDPERFNPYTAPVPILPPQPRGIYTGGANAPYTYPDLNNMFLAAVKSDGTVLMPSFHRSYTGFGPLDPNNPNWTGNNPALKYMVLRPRPADMGQGFPLPEDGGGDVKNLPPSSPGTLIPGTSPPQYWNNDSSWMDLGATVITDRNGKKFKPLFAPLILDLDGRVNLNVAGNVRLNAGTANPPGHASNQGWGPWEVDVSQVLNNINPALPRQEWTNLFLGETSVTYPGRYGIQQYPGAPATSQAPGDGIPPHSYSMVDYDGTDEANPMNPFGISKSITLPAAGSFSSFPTYNSSPTNAVPTIGGYGNNVPGPPAPPPPINYAGNPYEGYLHPLLYNYFQPNMNGSGNFNFPISNMEALLRYGDVNSSGGTSDLLRLCPTNLQGTSQSPMAPNSTSFIRNMVTTHNFDVDSPGISPWAIPPGSPGANFTLAAPSLAPSGPAASFPPLATRTSPQATNGEFNGVDWRAVSAALGKINLNRKLTPYTATTIQQADIDRQQFAADIFIRLVSVTGAYDLFNPTPPATPISPAQFDALRWLAQLSANIVDYIDSDDVMTTFNWTMPYNPSVPPGTYINFAYQNYPAQIQGALANFQTAATTGGMDPIGLGWVYGTELPRLLINEAYAQFKTTPPSTSGMPPTTPPPYTVQVDVWAELMNPFNTELTGADPASGVANLYNPSAFPSYPTGFSIYQIKLADTNSGNLRLPRNVNGDIITPGDSIYTQPPAPTASGGPCVLQFPASTAGTPIYGIGQTSPGPAPGFFLVGSNATPPTSFTMNPGASYAPTPVGSGNPNPMSYQIPSTTTPYPPPPPTILLQRLNNPYAAPNPPPGQPGNNPAFAPNVYVTVDYMEGGNLFPRTNPGIVWTVKDTSTPGAGPSFGRIQPYTGAKTQIQLQTPTPPSTNPNTFYAPNNSAAPASPYNWLTHLDRQLVSPMELLNVSAFKPHELTQQFNAQAYASQMQIPPPAPPPPPGVTPSYYGHRAPWFDEDLQGSGSSHFLYRLFEFLETGNRMTGMAPGGRIPAKMNVNTFYDQEILQAICAAQPAGSMTNPNFFDQGTVQNIFNQLMQLRSPGLAMGGDGQIHPTVNSGPPAPGQDQPFLSLAAGLSGIGGPPDQQYPGGLSIANTLMRSLMGPPPQPPLFQVATNSTGPVSHPYFQDQLISKIFNNLTTRSNVFAIWLTVGFFEVTDSSTRPVKLGAEIGKAENRQVRHRMFAIIDRTSLATEANNPSQLSPPPVFVNGATFGPPAPATAPPLVPLPPPVAALIGPNWPCISLPGAVPSPGNPNTGAPATTLAGTYDGISWGIQAYQPPAFAGAPPIIGTNLLIDMGASQELVNVVGIDQPGSATGPPPPARVFLSPTTLAHTGPLAVTPVNTISAYTPIPGGSGPVSVSVSAVSGVFEGVQWSLQGPSGTQPGTTVMVDIGPTRETAVVQSVTPPAGPGQPATVVLQAANPTGMFGPNGHAPGPLGAYTLSYPIPVLGNPGPQPSLNIRQVPWVVRYLSIIN